VLHVYELLATRYAAALNLYDNYSDARLVPNSTTRTPATDTLLITPPTDKLTTILQLVVRQITTNGQKFATSQHLDIVEMVGSGIAMWRICCITSCRTVVSSSVGGVVQHVRSRCPCSGVWHLIRTMRAARLTRGADEQVAVVVVDSFCPSDDGDVRAAAAAAAVEAEVGERAMTSADNAGNKRR